MNLTLLLDLDDTLLDTRMQTFIPAYFQALSDYLAGQVPPEKMLQYLMAGTRQMLKNIDPTRTLREAFDSAFFEPLGIPRQTLQPLIDRFYEECFPSLQNQTGGPRPGASEIVRWALAQGYTVAIATNPLFPLRAIEHRLTWAGLSPRSFPFALISSYETFHFTKAHPAYYAECLARLGWPEGPALMVGDDEEGDIRMAQQAGLAAYPIYADGGLNALPTWLEHHPAEQLQPKIESTSAIQAVLRSTPAVLPDFVQPLTSQDWSRSPFAGEWSVTEILCHLRDVETDVNLPRLRLILTDDNPFLPGQVTDVWALERDYAHQDGRAALEGFISARLQTLGLLADLPAESWLRTARHAIFGPTTLQELTGFMAEHDRIHVRQIYQTIWGL